MQVPSNSRPSLLLLALTSLVLTGLSGYAALGEGKEITALGGEGNNPWQEGGGGIDPLYIVSAQEVGTGNTPGGVVDFDRRQGWVYPESADKTENIALGLLARGGSVTAPTVLENLQAELGKMVDNDATTAFERKSVGGRPVSALGVVMQFDLGSRFGVSRVKFFPRNADPEYLTPDLPFQDDYIRAYELFLNDGSKGTQSGGLPVFTSALLEQQNDEPVVDLKLRPQYVRYLQLKSQTTVGFELAELQVFGEGFVPVAEYLSDVFDMGSGLALWGSIRWEEESIGDPLRSGVSVSTRSGTDDSPLVFRRVRTDLDNAEVPWKKASALQAGSKEEGLVQQFDAPGLRLREAELMYNSLSLDERNALALTRTDYNALKPVEKGSVRDDIVNWSLWSSPYAGAVATAEEVKGGQKGARISSPGPRRFFQFRVSFTSEELFSARAMGALSFDFSRPSLAEEVVAEVTPREAALGEVAEFSCMVLPEIRPGIDQGFSSCEITTPVRVSSVDRIALSLPGQTSMVQDFAATDLARLPATRGAFSIDLAEDSRFRITFPKVEASRIRPGQMALLSVTFRCKVLRTGTAFSTRVLPADPGGLPQEAIGGNVVELSGGKPSAYLIRNPANVVVQVLAKGKLLMHVQAVPRAFTPNGDRLNDMVRIDYDVTNLTSGAETAVRILDLSGRLVREVYAGSDKSGTYSRMWDGTNAQGDRVPPGIYCYQVTVDADTGHEETSGSLAVVY